MHYDPFGFAKTTTTPAMTPGIATSGFTGSFANIGNATGAGDIETLLALYPAWSKNVQIPEQGSRVTPAPAEFAGSTAYTHREDFKRRLAFDIQRDRLESQGKIPGQKSKSSATHSVRRQAVIRHAKLTP